MPALGMSECPPRGASSTGQGERRQGSKAGVVGQRSRARGYVWCLVFGLLIMFGELV